MMKVAPLLPTQAERGLLLLVLQVPGPGQITADLQKTGRNINLNNNKKIMMATYLKIITSLSQAGVRRSHKRTKRIKKKNLVKN
jgi:hypothetical protein